MGLEVGGGGVAVAPAVVGVGGKVGRGV